MKTLINISNHGSDRWSQEQFAEWNNVIDIHFPNIDPNASTEEVEAKVDSYMDQIRNLINKQEIGQPIDVMLMGEFTFVSIMLLKLKASSWDVRMWFSTTKREVIEKVDKDGNVTKTAVFKFVRWRHIEL